MADPLVPNRVSRTRRPLEKRLGERVWNQELAEVSTRRRFKEIKDAPLAAYSPAFKRSVIFVLTIMANDEHLKILMQGVEAWNRWRDENRGIQPDLSKTVISQLNFNKADFRRTNLSYSDLTGASFERATIGGSSLKYSDLTGANLAGADLFAADLTRARLCRANLRGAKLFWAIVEAADFSDSIMGHTTLTNLDLSKAEGLSAVRHEGPSDIGIKTFYYSHGKIPNVFLRGAGIPEAFIVNLQALGDQINPIEFYSCFISYSNSDAEFAERLYADLQTNRVRCWFAPEQLKIGDKLRPSFDEAIRLHDKLMVVLSESSVKSSWVEKEVETAFEKEHRQNRTVLFPIRLDDLVMETQQAWAADIRRTRHIGDFRDWKNHDCYKKAFERLLRDLKAEARTAIAKNES